jgi:hypothetical protein
LTRTVYDPFTIDIDTRGAPMRKADTKVSLTVHRRTTQRPVEATLID